MWVPKTRDFIEDLNEKIWGNQSFRGLGGVLGTSFGSTMLQEVWILPTLVYSYFLWIKNLFGADLRVVWN